MISKITGNTYEEIVDNLIEISIDTYSIAKIYIDNIVSADVVDYFALKHFMGLQHQALLSLESLSNMNVDVHNMISTKLKQI